MASTLDPSAVLTQLTEGFVKLPLIQKIIFPLLIVGSIAGIIMVSKWASAPDYAVLYSDLSAADSAAVIEKLKASKIKYEVRGDGSSIAISPPEAIHELRISLASEGVPKHGSMGYELLDKTSLGISSALEEMNIIRARQGELERTITALEVVESARVHITKPEKTVFAKDSNKPTAAVMLKLRTGGDLEKKQIRGIQNLVASSVEGMSRDDVTLVDVYGNLLTPKEEGTDNMGMEATRLQYQTEIERGYVQRIEQMLQKVLGPGKVVARVTADMDFSSMEREEESFDPGGQVIRSERVVDEGASSQQRGGVPGVVSNISDDPKLLAPKGASENSNHRESVKNYELSRAVTKSSSPRGKLVRLSAAVLVDGTYEAVQGAAEGTPKQFKPLDSETISRIESLAKSAIGYDSTRGDNITVENIPFYTPDDALVKTLDAAATQTLISNVVSWTLPVLFVILFFFFLVRPLVKFLVTPTEAEVDLTRLLPTGIKELEAELDAERERAKIPAFEPAVDLEQLEELMSENSKIVKENPQQAALLIRYWLNDGRL